MKVEITKLEKAAYMAAYGQACPKCGHGIAVEAVKWHGEAGAARAKCTACKAEWIEEVRLTGITEIDDDADGPFIRVWHTLDQRSNMCQVLYVPVSKITSSLGLGSIDKIAAEHGITHDDIVHYDTREHVNSEGYPWNYRYHAR